jgi:hypothetical protein
LGGDPAAQEKVIEEISNLNHLMWSKSIIIITTTQMRTYIVAMEG